MKKIKPQPKSKSAGIANNTQGSKTAGSSTSKTALKKVAPKKSLTTKTKPQTIKSITPVAKTLATKTVARKKPVESVVKKTSVASKSSNKSATKADSGIKKVTKVKKPAVKKQKLFRESFNLPEIEYALFKVLKQRAMEAGRKIKKNELLRAGMAALAAMPSIDLLKALAGVESIKARRAAKK